MPGIPVGPSTQLKGFIPQGRVEVIAANFVSHDYNGKAKARPCLHFSVRTVEDKMEEMYWPAGALVAVAPSDDGVEIAADDNGAIMPANYLCAASTTEINGLFGDQAMSVFTESLVKNGFPEDKMNEPDDKGIMGGAHVYVGMAFNCGTFSQTYKDREGKEKTFNIPVCTGGVELPGVGGKRAAASGGKKGAKGAPASNASPASASAASSGDGDGDGDVDVNQLTMDTIMALVAEKSTIATKDLPKLVFTTLDGQPAKVRAQAMGKARGDEFIAAMVGDGLIGLSDDGESVVVV